MQVCMEAQPENNTTKAHLYPLQANRLSYSHGSGSYLINIHWNTVEVRGHTANTKHSLNLLVLQTQSRIEVDESLWTGHTCH